MKQVLMCGAMLALLAGPANAQLPAYDLLLRGGHVIDPRNHIDGTMDVAIKDGHIAKVAPNLKPADAIKTIDVRGLVVTPGLIDLHTHNFVGTGERNSYAGDLSVQPDGFTFRTGVTTVVDAGCSGWRNFEDFKDKIVDRAKTRILVMLNIVGKGMRSGNIQQDLSDMDGEETAKMALKYPGVVVGIKTAHFTGPEWKPYEQAVKAGTIANIPVMIDYGARRIERPLYDLLSEKLRPGDIYTHCYSGLRGEQDPETGKASKALLIGRQRGLYFDVGHGGGSFSWTVAIPVVQGGFLPDSISTDLHVDSMNAGMKDMLNVADKFLAMGQTIPQVVTEMTWNPAHEVKQDQLGNLSVGAPADIAVLSTEQGNFGFVDMYNTKLMGKQKLICQLTVRAGKVVYDLNGISADLWDAQPTSDIKQAKRWTTFTERPFGGAAHQRFPASVPVK